MGEYIIGLFQNMSILTIVLLSAGILLCLVEVFVPKIGVTGILGIVLLGTGMSSYFIDGFKLKQFIGMLSIITLIIAFAIMIELILESNGVIKNPNRHKFRTYNSVPLNELIGKVGRACTNIDFGGTIDIDGKLYYATSNTYISQGSFIKVVAVNNSTLVVKGV